MSPDREAYRRKAAEAFVRVRSRIPSREQLTVGALWETTKLTLRHEIDDPDNHFGDARKHLADGGTLLIIVNHFDRLDTTVIGHVVEDNVSELDRVAGVTSLKYLDPTRSRLISRTINMAAHVKGFSTISVIQDTEEEKDYYEQNPDALKGKSKNRFLREAMMEAARFLNTPGSILMMAPEGTRSRNAKLLQAHEGLDSIMRLSRRNALILPIALIPNVRRIVPVYGKVVVRPGELFSLEDVLQEHEREIKVTGEKPELSITDRMMLRLAQLLLPRNQGYYRRFLQQA